MSLCFSILGRSVIRLTSEDRHYVEVETLSILHCTERRNFWLTWQYGAIEVGKGEIIGKERFMDYQPLELYDVRSIGYSTGYGHDGSWYILGTGGRRQLHDHVLSLKCLF